MKLKKLTALLLSAAMTATVLAGCGSSAPEGGDSAAEADDAAGDDAADDAAADDAEAGGDAAAAEASDPSDNEPYEATVMYWVMNENVDIAPIEEALNELTVPALNTTVKLWPISLGTYFGQIQMILSSDDALDIFPMFGTSAADYIDSEYIVDMAPYLSTVGKDMVEIIGADDVACDVLKGVQWGVPNMHERNNPVGVVVRTDIFEEAGFKPEDVKSLEDMTKVYEKVSEMYPDMIMYGLPADQTLPATYTVDELAGGRWGVLMNNGQDTTVVNYFESPEYVKWVKLLHEWFKKGYTSKDMATNTDTSEMIMKAGNSFSYTVYIKPNSKAEKDAMTGYDTTILPITDTVCYTGTTNAISYAISANSENPERAVELMNWIFKTKEANDLLNWGIKGRDYEVKEDGTIGLPEGVTMDSVAYHQDFGWAQFNQFNSYVWEGNDPNVWDQYREQRANAIISKAYGFAYDPTPVLDEVRAVEAVYNEKYKAVVSGANADADAALKEFNDALYAAGLQTIIDEKQKQLDEWLANNQ